MAKLPRGPLAAISALKFTQTNETPFVGLTEADWQALLKFCDKTQLTLPLNHRHGQFFPASVQEAIQQRLAAHAIRVQRTSETFVLIDAALRRRGVPFGVLKGFTHCPDFISDLRDRVQYDIDLYSPAGHYRDAYDALRAIGYEPIQALERFPVDHLPTLIRKTGWEWRNDFFDPELPLSVEIHFRLWDAKTERLHVEGLEDFWCRRTIRRDHGLEFTALSRVDKVGYACLHLLRHLLRGNLKPLHLYELASFLQTYAGDEAFWTSWQQFHHKSLRRLEAICFRLASQVFQCRLPCAVEPDIASLPEQVLRWFEEYGYSPVDSWFTPNKDELWLHMSLLESARDRRAVFLRRMFPKQLPGPVDAVHLPQDRITWRIRIRKSWRYLLFVTARVLQHTRAFLPTLVNALRWWFTEHGIRTQFFRFLAAASVFELGLFVFYLLYNLFLLDQGYREDFLGVTSSAMQVGGIVGAIPAGLAARKFGLRGALTCSLGALAIVSALRVILIRPEPLLVLAFTGGMLASAWMVCITPAVAELTPEGSRPFAFSLFIATGISIGILGGIVGGQLPARLASLGVPSAQGKRTALLIACGLIACGALLLSRLRLESSDRSESTLYPRNPALWRFLIVIAAFSLGTGAFNPLYTIFLSTAAGLSVERIGSVFATGQFMQVIAILIAPWIISRFGFRNTISWMFAGTGLALLCLGLGPVGTSAAAGYVAYMCFQYMSEPGIFSMLMSLASPAERKGASMLNFLVMNAAQAIAAAAAGVAIARFGYSPVLGTAAVFALLAAVLLRLLFRQTADSISSII